jgi:hypothetical protein
MSILELYSPIMKFPFLTRAKSRQCDVNVDCKSSKSDHDCFIIFPTYDPGWSGHPIVGGVAGGVAGVAITIGIVIWKRKRNAANTKQLVVLVVVYKQAMRYTTGTINRKLSRFNPLLYPCMPSRQRPQPSRPPFAPTVEKPTVKLPSVPSVAFPTEAPPLEVTRPEGDLWRFLRLPKRNKPL